MIDVAHLKKQYRKKFAVDDLSFKVLDGKVTGFLGPNGAGKSTTMRLMLYLTIGWIVSWYLFNHRDAN